MNKLFFYFSLALLTASLAYAQDQRLIMETSLQAGGEYDSNVFKTFQDEDKDFLVRIFFKNKADYWATNHLTFGWDFQGGGKKFVHDDAQDQVIQSLALPLHFLPSSDFQLIFDPNIKYQNERNKLDEDVTDINEDFLSSRSLLKVYIGLPRNFNIQPQGSFTYFKFFPDETFSFFREEGGINIEKKFASTVYGVEYGYLKQQFRDSFRKDAIHEISPYFQYSKSPFISLSYAYQFNDSNDPAFSFHNHKINFLTSFLFGKVKKNKHNANLPEARFSVHLIATIQLKTYSSVFAETPEGLRFLVTNSEDENFNNLIVKFNYHVYKNWAAETKYTRVSNDLTNQQTKFARSLYYAGLRYDF